MRSNSWGFREMGTCGGAMELGQGEARPREMVDEVTSDEVDGVKSGMEVGW